MSLLEIQTKINFLWTEEDYLTNCLKFGCDNKSAKMIEKRITEIHVEMEKLEIEQLKIANQILKTD